MLYAEYSPKLAYFDYRDTSLRDAYLQRGGMIDVLSYTELWE
jgi:hypothetical protein